MTRAMLVAVERQNDAKYAGRTTADIHAEWVKECFGEPSSQEQYGVRYNFDDLNISSEHDPRSLSDSIIINYLNK